MNFWASIYPSAPIHPVGQREIFFSEFFNSKEMNKNNHLTCSDMRGCWVGLLTNKEGRKQVRSPAP